MLGLEDVLAEFHNSVCIQVAAIAGVDHLVDGREALGDVESREGHEDAQATAVDSGGGNLQVPGKLNLSFF